MNLTSPTIEPTDRTEPGRVLVVDDEAAVRLLVFRVLRREGHFIAEAADTKTALELLGQNEFDVLIVDIIMPGDSGLELLQEVRAAHPYVVPILLTGLNDIHAAVGGMKLGAVDYIAKPADPDALCWAVMRGVETSRSRRRERVLERLVSEWTSTFDACPDLLLVLDAENRVIRANAEVRRRSGDAPDRKILGSRITDLFPDGLGKAITECGSETAHSAAASAVAVFDTSMTRHFHVSVSPIVTSTVPPTERIVEARDITELVDAESQRAFLMRRLITAQEDERGRLARELHDGIGQEIASLSVGLTNLANDIVDGTLREQALRLVQIANDSLEDVRRLAHGLRPPILDDFGLTTALTRLAEGFERIHGIKADVLIPAPEADRLPNEVTSAIYRIVQEAFNNTAKHSQARSVEVVLEIDEKSVRGLITDDGVGIATPASANPASGLGLPGMRQRVVLLGGTFRIDSKPGQGTTIDFHIPLPRAT
jgi:signal transduction histidine kinase